MSRATRVGDLNTGHDACPPVALLEGSSSVLINGKGAGRLGDRYRLHSCLDHATHADKIAEASSSVYIDGRPAARLGDRVDPEGSVAEASPDVYIGD